MEGRVPSKWPRHKLLDKYLRASPKVTVQEFQSVVTFHDQLVILRSFPGWTQFYNNGVIKNEAQNALSALLTFLFLGVDADLVRLQPLFQTIPM